ncbi:MAG TPA: HAD-IA family hydrolase [Candidatus Saccharimonadales bacterium]|nr:HAD-IA family hydrolase [Candidatus Saccharimonadales bacterium]
MVKAIIFDCFGVLISNDDGSKNDALLSWINELSKTYKIAVLSNVVSGGLNHYFSEEELEKYFDVTTTSGDAGYMKPDPEIYWHAAEQLEIEPSSCVFIDDTEGHCTGATDAGMHAIWYQNFEQAKMELEKLLNNPER